MCGIFAVFGHDDAAALTVLGLHALQHRGQDAAGITTFDGENFHLHRASGLVGDTFSKSSVVGELRGRYALGHNRYATSGAAVTKNIQPLYGVSHGRGFAIAHNGQLTNAHKLRHALNEEGAIFQTSTDTEVLMHLMAHSAHRHLEDGLVDALRQSEGAYSLGVLGENCLLAMRDPYGVHPLFLGRLDDAWLVASEGCAFDIVGGVMERSLAAGEMAFITKRGVRFSNPLLKRPLKRCLFEYIYFCRPDSDLDNLNVAQVREECGRILAREHATKADIVVPVPDSGIAAALGYAAESGLPYVTGIIRNHYVGRTFIEPTDKIRHLGVRLKHSANRRLLEGKRVVLIDDSIVRGTTSHKIVSLLRQAGVGEVHMRVASPPVTHSCFYGIYTPTKKELLASRMKGNVAKMRKEIGVDSLGFLSLEGLMKSAGGGGFCDACLTGNYPISLIDQKSKPRAYEPLLFETSN